MTNFIESGDDVKIYDAQNSIHLEHELMYQKDFSRLSSLRVVFRGLSDRGCSSTIPVTRRSITEWCIPFVLPPFYC